MIQAAIISVMLGLIGLSLYWFLGKLILGVLVPVLGGVFQ